jgi:acyl-CoA synthetase (NDP forming)
MSNLKEPEVMQLLKPYGVKFPLYAFVHTLDEVLKAAVQIGFPLVMKIVSAEIIHKTDVGGVRLNLQDQAAVQDAYLRIFEEVASRHPQASIEGMLLLQEASDGPEVIVGITQDKSFGPVLMFGLGGVFAEVLRDVSFRVIPIRKTDAEDMIAEVRGTVILDSWRGRNAADKEALVELLLSLSRFAVDHPEVKDLDLNPVRVYEKGVIALDAKAVMAE